MRNNLSPTARVVTGFAPSAALRLRLYPNALVPLLLASGWTAAIASGAGTNEVQTVAQGGTWTGGTFTLTFGGFTTDPIPYNATAAQVQRALEMLPSIDVGNVVCTGGALPGSLVSVTFVGALSATNVAALTASAAGLTGSTPSVTLATTTPGAAGAVTDPDGKGIATGATKWTFTKRSGAVAKSLQIIVAYNDDGIFWKGQGFGVQSLQIGADGMVSADLIGLYAVDIADPGETPSYDAASVLSLGRGDLLVSWLSGSANSSDFSTTIQNPIERPPILNGTRYPLELLHSDVVRVSGSVAKSRADSDDIHALTDGTQFASKARWRNPRSKIASSGESYAMFIENDGCQHVGGGAEAAANKRRHTGNFDWFAGYSDSAGRDSRITLISGTAAAETYP